MPMHSNCLDLPRIRTKHLEKMIPIDISLVLIVTIVQVKGPIIKTNEQWLCDYCAMGENKIDIIIYCIFYISSGSREDPEECGMPILCIFLCLLFVILCMFLYETIKGQRDFRRPDQIKTHMSIVPR